MTTFAPPPAAPFHKFSFERSPSRAASPILLPAIDYDTTNRSTISFELSIQGHSESLRSTRISRDLLPINASLRLFTPTVGEDFDNVRLTVDRTRHVRLPPALSQELVTFVKREAAESSSLHNQVNVIVSSALAPSLASSIGRGSPATSQRFMNRTSIKGGSPHPLRTSQTLASNPGLSEGASDKDRDNMQDTPQATDSVGNGQIRHRLIVKSPRTLLRIVRARVSRPPLDKPVLTNLRIGLNKHCLHRVNLQLPESKHFRYTRSSTLDAVPSSHTEEQQAASNGYSIAPQRGSQSSVTEACETPGRRASTDDATAGGHSTQNAEDQVANGVFNTDRTHTRSSVIDSSQDETEAASASQQRPYHFPPGVPWNEAEQVYPVCNCCSECQFRDCNYSEVPSMRDSTFSRRSGAAVFLLHQEHRRSTGSQPGSLNGLPRDSPDRIRDTALANQHNWDSLSRGIGELFVSNSSSDCPTESTVSSVNNSSPRLSLAAISLRRSSATTPPPRAVRSQHVQRRSLLGRTSASVPPALTPIELDHHQE